MKILTFDIEDWFHFLDFEPTRKLVSWNNFESRIHRNMDIIHEILSEKNLKATFFVLAWIAEKYPNVVKKISQMGYQIGSHTYSHQLVYKQKKSEFQNDVEKSIKIIEDLTGNKVECFRAPGFSIKNDNLWAFEVLKNLGINYDSSIFAAPRSHGGFENFDISEPCIISYKGISLKEFPINTNKFMGINYVFSGGGYFRLIPYFLLKKLFEKNDYVMTYFHPRDFDYYQPVFSEMSYVRKFKSYVGLKGCKIKLRKILDKHEFYDIEAAAKKIDWKKIHKYDL